MRAEQKIGVSLGLAACLLPFGVDLRRGAGPTAHAQAEPSGLRLYVANSGSGTVAVIDPSRKDPQTAVVTLPEKSNPQDVAVSPDGARVYVTCPGLAAEDGSGSVAVFDATSGSPTFDPDAEASTIKVGRYPKGVTVSPDGARLYVTNSHDGSVSVIDPLTREVLATPSVGQAPGGVAVSPDCRHVYVANSLAGTVSVLDAAAAQVIATVGVGRYPQRVAVAKDGSRLYVSDLGDDSLSVISTSTNRVIDRLPCGRAPYSVAMNPDGLRLYAASLFHNRLSIIHGTRRRVIATVAADNAADMVVSRDGHWLYVTHPGEHTLSVVDTDANAVIATVPVGETPLGVAVRPDDQGASTVSNQSPVDRRVYVVTNQTPALWVIEPPRSREATPIAATVRVGQAPHAVAASPDHRYLYVANSTSHTVSVLDTSRNRVVATV